MENWKYVGVQHVEPLLLLAALFLSAPLAQEGRVVKSVEVAGNKRVETTVIRGQIKTRAGEEFSSAVLREDVKRLYSLGYFSDVMVDMEEEKEGLELTFIVEEKSLIREIRIEGNRALKEKYLLGAISSRAGQTLEEKAVKEDMEKIIGLYEEKGYPLAKVEYELEMEGDEATLILHVNEGTRLKIKKIIIMGNEAISYEEVRRQMKIGKGNLYFFGRGHFKEETFREDLKRIIELYRQRGFMEAKIRGEPRREYDEEGKHLTITITIQEGLQFKVGNIEITGNEIMSREEIEGRLNTRVDMPYSREAIKADANRIRALYAEKGYIFARVELEMALDRKEQKANIHYSIVEGKLAYIERVEVVGNIITRDKVIRREITIKPGDVFNLREIERSRWKIYNLGYFEEVGYDTMPGSLPHMRNLIFEVKERKTGYCLFGLGYSSEEKLLGFVEVTQKNFDLTNYPSFSGGGQNMRLKLDVGTEKTSAELNFTEPWLFDRPLSFGLDAYDTTRDWDDYDEEREGGRITLGHPLWESVKGYLSYCYEDVTVSEIDEDASCEIKKEEGTFTTSSMKLSMIRDVRDNFLDPTRGSRSSFSVELAGGMLGGEKDFVKYIGETSWYYPIRDKHVLNLRLKGGLVEEYGDSEYVPIYERFFLGGGSSLRGYDYREVGPKDSRGEEIGGELMLLANVEYIFPIAKELKGALFYDVGNVWREREDFDISDLRSGTGIGLRVRLGWFRINLDYGFALDREPGEPSSCFHWTMGYSF